MFHATGTAEELVAYFRHICGALRALPLQRSSNEARVLRTEAAGRSPSVVEALLWYRYGARGHGAVFYREFALVRPDEAAIQAWAAANFTAGNATAWFSGPIPAGLRFDLPDGPRRPAPEPRPLAGLASPTWIAGQSGGIAVSMVGPRRDWLFVPLRIAALRVQQRMRYEEGLTYHVDVGYVILSADQSHSTLVASSLDEHAQAVQDDVLDVLSSMASDGPTEAELVEAATDFDRGNNVPEAIFGMLDARAFNALLGAPVQTREELSAELRAMTPDSVARVVHDSQESALLLIPNGVECRNQAYRPYPGNSTSAVVGTTHRSVNAPYPWSKKQPELIVGSDGVSWVTPPGDARTVRYADLAVAFERADGAIELLGTDGFHVVVLASEWRGGARALERVRSAIPAELLVQDARA